MANIIIARGRLDYAHEAPNGVWLIHDDRLGVKVLDGLLVPHIGQRITISREEPEEEPIMNPRLKKVLANA